MSKFTTLKWCVDELTDSRKGFLHSSSLRYKPSFDYNANASPKITTTSVKNASSLMRFVCLKTCFSLLIFCFSGVAVYVVKWSRRKNIFGRIATSAELKRSSPRAIVSSFRLFLFDSCLVAHISFGWQLQIEIRTDFLFVVVILCRALSAPQIESRLSIFISDFFFHENVF